MSNNKTHSKRCKTKKHTNIKNDIHDLTDKFSILSLKDTTKIIKIQSFVRGYITRKKLQQPKDKMSIQFVDDMLNQYNQKLLFNQEINKQLSKKKIRNENFPSEISENIVKFCLYKKYKIMGCWDTNEGDLILLNNKIEVKGFMSSGPSSFGPTETWDRIYFVDCKDTLNKNFKVFEIKLSNNNIKWKNIKLNKTQTFDEQCCEKRRPRLAFEEIQKQLGNDCKLIFYGNIKDLY